MAAVRTQDVGTEPPVAAAATEEQGRAPKERVFWRRLTGGGHQGRGWRTEDANKS